MASIRRILVPTDFSPGAQAALDGAAALAERFDAAVDVVYVWRPPASLSLQTLTAGRPQETLSDLARREATAQMWGFLGGDEIARPRIRARIEVGAPHELIVTLAATERHDLIVMGACGAGSSRTSLGSVTRLVLDSAPCPVLTLRAPSRPSAAPQPAARPSY
jgi:nucleotide-binding universal stress UspA family protein